MIIATMKILASAISKKKSQPKRISWSQRNRGNVQRTHIMKKIKTATLVKKMTMSKNENTTLCAQPGSGEKSQPQKNTGTDNDEPVIMPAYSPKKKSANFIAEYSV